MSQRIVIAGSDLDYFKGLVSQALSGDLGTLTEIRVVANDDGTMSIGTNGYVSNDFGRDPDAVVTCSECGAVKEAVTTAG